MVGGLLMLAALGIGGIAHFAQPLLSLIWFLVILAAALGAIWVLVAAIRRRRSQTPAAPRQPTFTAPLVVTAPAPPSTQALLRQIDWYQFEKVIGRLLTIEGFQVEQLGGAKADGGVDLIARRNGEKILVQCKHWHNWKVKAATIREMVGALKITGGDRMGVYTLNSSTDQAAQLASAQGIRIVTEREIVHRIESVGASRFADLLDPSKKACPACDRPMVLRQGNFPSFWGCSRFPVCREKITIRQGSAAADRR